MRRLRVTVGLLTFMSLLMSLSLQQAIGGDPTAEAIQTQVAELEATLTAIAGTPTATPNAPMEFDIVTSSDVPFHIVITSFAPLHRPLYDTLYDKNLDPRGQFVALQFEVTNMGTEPVSFWYPSELLIRDNEGRAFSMDSDASRTLLLDLDLYESEFQPSFTYDHVLVYDVAKDATTFTLEVEHTQISIPLTLQAPIQ